jgi:hypothetical protein
MAFGIFANFIYILDTTRSSCDYKPVEQMPVESKYQDMGASRSNILSTKKPTIYTISSIDKDKDVKHENEIPCVIPYFVYKNQVIHRRV